MHANFSGLDAIEKKNIARELVRSSQLQTSVVFQKYKEMKKTFCGFSPIYTRYVSNYNSACA